MEIEHYTHTQTRRSLPSGSGSKVMAVLRRPLPKLTRWGRSAWTFRDLPVSIRSKGVLCQNTIIRDQDLSSLEVIRTVK